MTNPPNHRAVQQAESLRKQAAQLLNMAHAIEGSPVPLMGDTVLLHRVSRESAQVRPSSTGQGPSISVSLDGGITFIPATEGVRVAYANLPVAGEDEAGELHLNFSQEGIVQDLWVTRDEPLDHNIGTASQMIGDLVSELVEAGA